MEKGYSDGKDSSAQNRATRQKLSLLFDMRTGTERPSETSCLTCIFDTPDDGRLPRSKYI